MALGDLIEWQWASDESTVSLLPMCIVAHTTGEVGTTIQMNGIAIYFDEAQVSLRQGLEEGIFFQIIISGSPEDWASLHRCTAGIFFLQLGGRLSCSPNSILQLRGSRYSALYCRVSLRWVCRAAPIHRRICRGGASTCYVSPIQLACATIRGAYPP